MPNEDSFLASLKYQESDIISERPKLFDGPLNIENYELSDQQANHILLQGADDQEMMNEDISRLNFSADPIRRGNSY